LDWRELAGSPRRIRIFHGGGRAGLQMPEYIARNNHQANTPDRQSTMEGSNVS
jgi:hypothetical protein